MVENYSNYLFICIFWILHSSFSLLDYLLVITNKVFTKLRLKLVGDRFLDLQQVKNLNKLPKHIAFIVLEDPLSYSDLASLVIWCIAAEINVISLFDMHGKLKRNQEVLLTEVNKKYSELSIGNGKPFNFNWRPHIESTNSRNEQTVIVNRNGIMYPDTNGNGNIVVNGNGKNGSGAQDINSVTISLLAPEDGKFDMVLAARAIGLKVQDRKVVLNEINEDLVGSTLRSNKNLPDPCLLVRLGRIASNADFLPWQIRLTEIHSIPSHHQIRSSQLLDVLQKFGTSQQRFGK
eukprot:GFUD01033041.1.p1 GENE.GFUD01033041.1~~GFUD01033041.1.p1  ORF type:complete len:291 (+),score=29.78 GFUD01033041.1:56-928(+)